MPRALFTLFVIAALTSAAEPDLDSVLNQVRSEVKPEQAMEYMRRVYSTDRGFTFPKCQETAEYLRQAMQQAGLEQIEVLGAPADGVTQAGYWTEPLAWDVKQARPDMLGV